MSALNDGEPLKIPQYRILDGRSKCDFGSGLRQESVFSYTTGQVFPKPGAPSMDGTAVGVVIVVALVFAQPPVVKPIEQPTQRQAGRIDERRANDVTYFDAPIHSLPTVLR